MTSPDRPAARPASDHDGDHDLHEYAGGYIQAHHGSIPLWLMAVYFILFVWALYYAYVYWGSLGPGLAQ
jgi:hypothetical protein